MSVDEEYLREFELPFNFDFVTERLHALQNCVTKCTREALDRVFTSYEGTFAEKIGCTRDCEMVLNTGMNEPCNSRPFKKNPAAIEQLKVQIQELLRLGIVRKSNSEWASAAWLIEKRGQKEQRMVIDYRELNRKTIADRYRPPRIDVLLDGLAGCQIFSTLDLRSGFYQIPVHPESVKKTAFITPFGQYEFLRMPFGLKNAPAVFQRMMDTVLEDLLGDFCLVYLDDVIVYSKTLEEHEHHLKEVLKRFKTANLTVKLSKCKFFEESITYLGHEVSINGIIPAEKNVLKTMSRAIPQNLKELRSFLGMVGHYRRFIKDFATVADPLFSLVKKDAAWQWSSAQQEAYAKLCDSLTGSPFLLLPDWDKEFTLETDASKVGIGAVLSQEGLPIAFGSKSLNETERRYSTTDREMLAIVHFCDHFRYYLEGRTFKLRTDHEPLVYMASKEDPHFKWARWISRIQCYDFQIEYISGKENHAADYFSRVCGVRCVFGIDDSLKEDQREDPQISEFWNQGFSADNPLQRFKRSIHENSLGFLSLNSRIIVPKSKVKDILTHWHDVPSAGHIGVGKMLRQIRRRFFWIGLEKDIKDWVKSCPVCQSFREAKVKHSLKTKVVNEIFHTLQMDLTTFKGSKILVVVDAASRYPFAFVLERVTANEISQKLLEQVFPFTGLPLVLQSDNEQCLSGNEISCLSASLGILKHETMIYHPQAQGIVERCIQTIKKRLAKSNRDVKETLPLVIMGMRNEVNESIGMSPNECLFGEPLRSLGDVAFKIEETLFVATSNNQREAKRKWLERMHTLDEVRKIAQQAREESAALNILFQEEVVQQENLKVGDKVLFRPSSSRTEGRTVPVYSQMLTIVGIDDSRCKVSDEHGIECWLHRDNLKLAALRPEETVESYFRGKRRRIS